MVDIDHSKLSEKQRTELTAAEAFLAIYNQRKNSSFEPVEVEDVPDIRCTDSRTGKILEIEVTLLVDKPDDVPYLLDRIKVPDEFSPQRVVDFRRDVIPRLASQLEEKLLSNYGAHTALLIRQVGPLWTTTDWEREAPLVVSKILKDCEKVYGMGIWILCSKTKSAPVSNDLFALYDPDVGMIESKPTIAQNEHMIGRVTWENNILPDFDEFTKRDDVDPVIRIDSPHSCEYAILIAFLHSEPEDLREEAINFYRMQMVFYCPCGEGSARLIGNWIKY